MPVLLKESNKWATPCDILDLFGLLLPGFVLLISLTTKVGQYYDIIIYHDIKVSR